MYVSFQCQYINIYIYIIYIYIIYIYTYQSETRHLLLYKLYTLQVRFLPRFKSWVFEDFIQFFSLRLNSSKVGKKPKYNSRSYKCLIYLYMSYTYISIYIGVCMCVCVSKKIHDIIIL